MPLHIHFTGSHIQFFFYFLVYFLKIFYLFIFILTRPLNSIFSSSGSNNPLHPSYYEILFFLSLQVINYLFLHILSLPFHSAKSLGKRKVGLSGYESYGLGIGPVQYSPCACNIGFLQNRLSADSGPPNGKYHLLHNIKRGFYIGRKISAGTKPVKVLQVP